MLTIYINKFSEEVVRNTFFRGGTISRWRLMIIMIIPITQVWLYIQIFDHFVEYNQFMLIFESQRIISIVILILVAKTSVVLILWVYDLLTLQWQYLYSIYLTSPCSSTVHIGIDFTGTSPSPSNICSSETNLATNGLLYISTSATFPISNIPLTAFQCTCSFSPLDTSVKATVNIRVLVVYLNEYDPCLEQLVIQFSNATNAGDTTYCSRSVNSSDVISVHLESRPYVTSQRNLPTTQNEDRILLEIKRKKSIDWNA